MNKQDTIKILKEIEEKSKEYIELMMLTKKLWPGKYYSGLFGYDDDNLTILIEDQDNPSDWLKISWDLLSSTPRWNEEVTNVISSIKESLEFAEKTKDLIKQKQKEAKERALYKKLREKFKNEVYD